MLACLPWPPSPAPRPSPPPHLRPHQACPLFGKLSDVLGRRTGLVLTVCGTTVPIVALALTQSMWVYAVAQVGALLAVRCDATNATCVACADLSVRGPTCHIPQHDERALCCAPCGLLAWDERLLVLWVCGAVHIVSII
jgi:hypothetical protein